MTDYRQITHDGYVIVPEHPKIPDRNIVGTQCGKCGLRVKNGEGIGFCCSSDPCPMGLGSRVTMETYRGL